MDQVSNPRLAFKFFSEADFLPQRNVNSNTGESEELPTEVADFRCALCMRYGDTGERLRPDCRDSLSDCSEPEGLRFLAGWSLSESSSEWDLRDRRGLPASLPDLFWFSSDSLSEEAPFFRRSPSSACQGQPGTAESPEILGTTQPA